MIYCLETLFNNGADNDADVTINCSNGQKFMAHSFVLSYCSDLYKTMSDTITPGSKIVWDLSTVDIDNVRNVVSNMYVLSEINQVDDIKSKRRVNNIVKYKRGVNNMLTFFNVVEYIQPSIFFKRAIYDIVSKYSTLIEDFIRYGVVVQKSVKKTTYNSNNLNRRLLEFLIELKSTDNEYIRSIQTNITKKFTYEIKILSSIRDLCMANNDVNPFIDYDADRKADINNDADINNEADINNDADINNGNFSDIDSLKKNLPYVYKMYVQQEMPRVNEENPGLTHMQCMELIANKWRNQNSDCSDVESESEESSEEIPPQNQGFCGYKLFVKQQLAIIKRENPTLRGVECMRLIGERWKNSCQNPNNRNRQ